MTHGWSLPGAALLLVKLQLVCTTRAIDFQEELRQQGWASSKEAVQRQEGCSMEACLGRDQGGQQWGRVSKHAAESVRQFRFVGCAMLHYVPSGACTQFFFSRDKTGLSTHREPASVAVGSHKAR